MLFVELVRYLEKLEGTSSRLAITDILVELLKKLGQEEVEKAVYLMLGELAPKFRKKEFNMAEKMVIRAIARVAGKGEAEITSAYKVSGDLGQVVQKVTGIQESKLSINEVYDRLERIAQDGGQGSQERKVEALADLLKEVDPLSAKFTTRIVLDKLRLGFSDKTILDALSVLDQGNKLARKKLDNAYQIYPDVGRLAKAVCDNGVANLENTVMVEVGVPVEPALCQRLNSSAEIIEKMGEVGVEQKFDGTRVQIHFERGKGVRTFTRNLDETSQMFPELKGMEGFVEAQSLILDSEAVGVDLKSGRLLLFQETIKRKRKHEVEETALQIPLRFYVFDVLYYNGESTINKPYFERRKLLESIIFPNKTLVVDVTVKTGDAVVLHQAHERFLSEGFEGAVIKKWDGKYLPGRQGWNWVKIKESEGTTGKLTDTLDLVVMGYNRGRGKRASFGIGAFLAGIRSGEEILTITKVGTGLTDDLFRELKSRLDRLVVREKPREYIVDKNLAPDVWVEPKLVVEIAADELTKSPLHTAGVALRFPRLVKFRDDKDLAGVTTMEEIGGLER